MLHTNEQSLPRSLKGSYNKHLVSLACNNTTCSPVSTAHTTDHAPVIRHLFQLPSRAQGCICDIPHFCSVPGDVLHFSWGPFPVARLPRRGRQSSAHGMCYINTPKFGEMVLWCLQPSRGTLCYRNVATKPCMGSSTCPHVLP